MAILTVAELRQHVDYPTGVDADAALQLLLDASEEAIVKRAGAAGSVTELVDGGGPTLILGRPIASIAGVTEDFDGTPLVLAANDYRFTVGGYVLRRLSTGTNSGYVWHGTTQVVFVPEDDSDSRAVVQVALVRLFLGHHPGLSSHSIGDWSESFSAGDASYAAERDGILSTLSDGPGMVIF